MGKLHFWLLPNLTAECGFFESFVPAYQYTVYKKEEKVEEKSSDVDDDKDKSPQLENEDESEKSENGDWVKVKKDDAKEDGEEEVLS